MEGHLEFQDYSTGGRSEWQARYVGSVLTKVLGAQLGPAPPQPCALGQATASLCLSFLSCQRWVGVSSSWCKVRADTVKAPSTCPPQSWCLRGARGFLLSVCLSLLCSRVSQTTGLWASRGAKEVGDPIHAGSRGRGAGCTQARERGARGPPTSQGRILGGFRKGKGRSSQPGSL